MKSYCGYVALIGRPNVGKSTLLNHLLKMKVSITSRKPQTTRHRILGVHTRDPYQFIFVDTPGIHQDSKKAINRMMNKEAINVLRDVDVVVWVLEALDFTSEDEFILKLLQEISVPCFLVVNKVDKVKDKKELLPYLEKVSQLRPFKEVVPLCARTGYQVDSLESMISTYLPENPYLFDKADITDRSARFLCSEWIREKIFRGYGQEIPYMTSVEIESFKEEEGLCRIHALIWVDKESHKRILIGNKGQKLKEIATQARIDMEKLLNKKVYLKCWCKVKSGWSDNENALRQFGYGG